MTFRAVVPLAVAGLIACDSRVRLDNRPCQTSNDCIDGYVCFDGTCTSADTRDGGDNLQAPPPDDGTPGLIDELDLGATFVVDVKSTGLFATDPVLLKNGVKADYWKTGHSYIKRRVSDLNALAGFEKSGHFFFNAPIGRGYDDGLVTAIAVLDMLERNPTKSMSDLYADLPKTWGSPTMSPHCADEVKYDVIAEATDAIEAMRDAGETLIGQKIRDVTTVNGVRVTVEDGTWGLVRASSNKPELVVVVESPASEANMRAMFHAVDGILRRRPEVGAYNQTI